MALILKINDRFRNRELKLFESFQFNLIFNSVGSTFSFTTYFDPFKTEHKEMMCVSHFHEVTLDHIPDGTTTPIRVLTGIITNQRFSQNSTNQLATFSGYSLPGVLEDCTIPTFPLQSDGLTLRQIANKLINPFKLKLNVDPDVSSLVDSTYKTTQAQATQTVKDYLHTLAKQKDVILSHDENGNLLLTKAKVNQDPIFRFDLENGTPDGFSFEMEYDGQGMHRTITAMKDASIDGGNAGQEQVINPYVIGSVFRPTVINQTSGDDNDTGSAAKRARANELRGITLGIDINGWTIGNKLITPNNTIEIIAPHLYIYRKENFFIESVNYVGNASELTCRLNCVLPEVYNQAEPVNIYRGINLHPVEE